MPSMKHFSFNGHRKPPAPIHWNSPPGICRWCGCCILHERGPLKGKPNFKNWHNRCAEEFKLIFWPAETRAWLHKTRGEACEDCKKPLEVKPKRIVRDEEGLLVRLPNGKWKYTEVCEVHHVVQLSEYDHRPEDPWAAWREGNLALLCHDCHMARHHKIEETDQMMLFEEVKSC